MGVSWARYGCFMGINHGGFRKLFWNKWLSDAFLRFMNHNFITNNIRENEWKWWKLNGELVISPADMNCDILGCTETKDTWVTLKLVFLYHLCILMIGKLRIWYQLMPLTSGGDGSLHWWPLIVEPMIANGLVKGKTDWWNQELNSLKSRLFQVQVCFLT